MTFSTYTHNETNLLCFDSLIKNDTYAFLHFIPNKRSPKNYKVNISIYDEHKILIEEYDYILEFDNIKKAYQDHYIGIQQDGTNQRVIFSIWNIENNSPLNKTWLEVAVVKIKDGNEDKDDGIEKSPIKPKTPNLIEYEYN